MAVTINWVHESAPIGMYIVEVTVTANADTLAVPLGIRGAIFQPNRINAAADSYGVTFTRGAGTITFSLINTTSVSGTLWVIGDA